MIDTLLALSLTAIIITTIGVILSSAVDDYRNVRRQRLFNAHPYSRRFRARPLVTILLIAGHDTQTTKNALKHLRKSSYRQLECIIIASAHERAKLKKVAKSFARQNRPVHVFVGKKSEQFNLTSAYRRYGHGDIILALRDTEQLDPSAIKQTVWHFNAQQDVEALYARTLISSRHSTNGLLQTYLGALSFFWNKITNCFGYEQAPDDSRISFYRAKTFLARHSLTYIKTYAAEDVIAYRPATSLHGLIFLIYQATDRLVVSLRKIATSHRRSAKRSFVKILNAVIILSIGCLLITLPLLLGYFVVLAATLHQPILLFASIGILSIYLLLGIWSYDIMPRQQKVGLSLLLPAYLAPLYLCLVTCCISLIIAFLLARPKSFPSFASLSKRAPLH